MQWRSFLNDQLLSASPPKLSRKRCQTVHGQKSHSSRSSNLNIPRTLDVKAKQIGFINTFHQKLNGTLSKLLGLLDTQVIKVGPAGDVLDNIIISILSHFSKWYNLQLDIVHAVNRHTWRFEVPLKRRSPPDEADSPSQCGQVRNVEVTHGTWFTDSSSRDFRVGRIWESPLSQVPFSHENPFPIASNFEVIPRYWRCPSPKLRKFRTGGYQPSNLSHPTPGLDSQVGLPTNSCSFNHYPKHCW